MRHVVALSGGKDSTAMALRLRELNPTTDYEYICTPVGNELPELFEHLYRMEARLGKPLVRITAKWDGAKVVGWTYWQGDDELDGVIRRQAMIPNFRSRFCTRMLKIEPTMAWLTEHAPCVQYVGLRADEPMRKGMYGDMDGVSQAYPMRDWGWGIDDVWQYLEECGVTVPRRTDCALCFYQRLVEWKALWRDHRPYYADGETIEAEIGHTFRSDGRDTWPASLTDLAVEFEKGRKPRGEEAQRQGLLFQNCDMDAQCRVCSM